MVISCHQARLLPFLALFLALPSLARSQWACEYIFSVKTGPQQYAGTNSTISLILYSEDSLLPMRNLSDFETPDHTGKPPFSRDSVSVFTRMGVCMRTPICSLKLISDGSGSQPGWYVEYVTVIMDSEDFGQDEIFTFNQWLSVDDPPYQLEATRGDCPLRDL